MSQQQKIQKPDQQIKTQQSAQNSNEDLKSQLKQKNKQNKILTTKNSKLQAKYVELFREHKLIKKDHECFVNVLEEIVPNFQKKQFGTYDGENIKRILVQKQEKLSSKIQEMMQQAAHQKRAIQKKIQQEMELKIQNKDEESKNYLQNLNRQLQGLKKSNKTFSEQIIDLDKKLDAKNNQVSKLTKQKLKLEHIINQNKVKEISEELGQTKKQNNEKNNNQRNQFLALRQQVDSLMLKRDQLRAQLKENKKIIKTLQDQVKDKANKIKDLQNSLTLKQQQHHKLKNQLQINNTHKSADKLSEQNLNKQSSSNNQGIKQEELSHHFSVDDQFVHRQYIKNVFIRYMKCYRGGDYTQADILENIILTILKFTMNQRQQIKIKKKGWF